VEKQVKAGAAKQKKMSKPVVEVQVRAVGVTSGGCAVFLGNEDKVFVMFVDQSVGTAIAMFMQGTQKERPLTHDLLGIIVRALGAKIERVIVNDLKRGTYFARLVLPKHTQELGLSPDFWIPQIATIGVVFLRFRRSKLVTVGTQPIQNLRNTHRRTLGLQYLDNSWSQRTCRGS